MLEVTLVCRQLVLPKAAVGDVALELMRVRHSPTRLVTVDAAPAAERADPGAALVIDDVIGVPARITRRSLRCDEAGEPETGADVDQHILKRANVAVWDEDRLPDRIGRTLDAANRSVEQRYTVPAFEIGRIGQNQIRVGDHF